MQTREQILEKARARRERLYTSPEGRKRKAEIDKANSLLYP